MIIGELLGVLFGVFGALQPNRLVDDLGQGVSVIGLGIPSFVIGTGLVTVLASVFHYFPSSEGFASIIQQSLAEHPADLLPRPHAEPRDRGGDHADDAGRDARGDRAELRPHGSRQGPLRGAS